MRRPLHLIGLGGRAIGWQRRHVGSHVAFTITNQSAEPDKWNTAPGAAIFLQRADCASGEAGHVILSEQSIHLNATSRYGAEPARDERWLNANTRKSRPKLAPKFLFRGVHSISPPPMSGADVVFDRLLAGLICHRVMLREPGAQSSRFTFQGMLAFI